jgi:uncharacterized protein (DUF736 family)
MSIIGKIKKDDHSGQLQGYISTLQLKLQFWLESSGMSKPNSPAYHIFCNSPGGKTQVGAVWKKISQKPGHPPSEFMSMTFDDPSFAQALNVAAFPNQEGGWDVSFRRRQERQAA